MEKQVKQKLIYLKLFLRPAWRRSGQRHKHPRWLDDAGKRLRICVVLLGLWLRQTVLHTLALVVSSAGWAGAAAQDVYYGGGDVNEAAAAAHECKHKERAETVHKYVHTEQQIALDVDLRGANICTLSKYCMFVGYSDSGNFIYSKGAIQFDRLPISHKKTTTSEQNKACSAPTV